MDEKIRDKKINQIINLGLISNFLLAIIKTSTGIIGHSAGLLADGINSTADVVYFIFAKIFTRMSQKPADKEHPYGHKQLESISTVVVGAFIITTGVAVIWDSINMTFDYFYNGMINEPTSILALYIAIASIVVKIGLFYISMETARKVNNSTVMAIAYDHRNDIFSSLAAAFGILMAKLDILWVDPLAGAFVGLIIFKTGISVIIESSNELMATGLNKEIYNNISKSVSKIKGVKGIEEIKATAYGPYMFINLVILVKGDISVREGDDIAEKVETKILSENKFVKGVHIHYHPGRKDSK
jgi:cation diffusion facilitator family transporter